MRTAIYARVSTRNKQEVDNQLVQLREYCQRQGYDIFREYVDHESGSNPDRPAFKQLFADAKQYDVLLFWALDRFSREGAKETINYLSMLEAEGVKFVSFTEPYLSSMGVFKDVIIALLGTLAKQERIRIRERVLAGVAFHRAQGSRFGRVPFPEEDRRRIIAAHVQDPGKSIRQLAEALQMSRGTVHKTIKNYKASDTAKSTVCEVAG